jgi:D-sedoheptulose 7-phosphate isomerase
MPNFIANSLDQASQILNSFIQNEKNLEMLERAIEELTHTFKENGKVFSCGNGGSMCDAMHFAEELTGRYRKDRRPLPATAISDPGYLSCVANDFGYNEVFGRHLEAWGEKDDCLLAISTSGNSPNVILAAEVARKKGLKTIALLGKDGGKLKSLVDIPIIVESQVTDRIQEIHIKIIHLFIEVIEMNLFPSHYNLS